MRIVVRAAINFSREGFTVFLGKSYWHFIKNALSTLLNFITREKWEKEEECDGMEKMFLHLRWGFVRKLCRLICHWWLLEGSEIVVELIKLSGTMLIDRIVLSKLLVFKSVDVAFWTLWLQRSEICCEVSLAHNALTRVTISDEIVAKRQEEPSKDDINFHELQITPSGSV